MNKMNIGLKFTDSMREYEVVEVLNIKGVEWFRLKNYTDNKENEIMEQEQIEQYLSNQDALIEKLEYRKVRAIENELEHKRIEEQERQEKEDYNNDYGFTSNKTLLQKGKILKTLNMEIKYNNEVITRKKRIYNIITGSENVYTKELLNTNRHTEKRICLEYKKLKDKKEYRLYFNNSTFIDLTKTEYDFANYLLDNKKILLSSAI